VRAAELLRVAGQVAFYAASVGVLGYHLSLGWSKARAAPRRRAAHLLRPALRATRPRCARAQVALKIGLPQPFVKPAAAIGRFLVWPLCLGFAAVPVYLWLGGQSCRAGLPTFA